MPRIECEENLMMATKLNIILQKKQKHFYLWLSILTIQDYN